MKTEKLKLNRETLRVLTDAEAHRVAGGLRAEFSEMKGCSEGGGPVCTANCPVTPGSGTCTI